VKLLLSATSDNDFTKDTTCFNLKYYND